MHRAVLLQKFVPCNRCCAQDGMTGEIQFFFNRKDARVKDIFAAADKEDCFKLPEFLRDFLHYGA